MDEPSQTPPPAPEVPRPETPDPQTPETSLAPDVSAAPPAADDPAPSPAAPPPLPPLQHGLFRGRLNRVGFLLGLIYPAIAYIAFLLVVFVLQTLSNSAERSNASLSIAVIIVALLFILAVIPLSFSVQIRRWHDMGQSGWFCLFSLIPVAGLVVLIIQLFNPGTPGSNAYGDPYTGGPHPLKVFGLR